MTVRSNMDKSNVNASDNRDNNMASPLYYQEKDDDDYDDHVNVNDKVSLLESKVQKSKKYKRSFHKNNKSILQSLPAILIQKRLINLRSILLSLSLSTTLLVFWILDSLKDPTLSIMVMGDLHKHQPLAKMSSVVGTLVLVMTMEFISYERKKQQQQRNKDVIQRSDEDVIDGGGKWTKMIIGSSSAISTSTTTSFFNNHNENSYPNAEDNNEIHISVFRNVGLAYISVFFILSYIINLHPHFDTTATTATTTTTIPTNIITPTTNNNIITDMKQQSIWKLVGYLQYVAIESYGSIAVATFWSFTNSTLTLKAAKTFYGFIIAIAQLGAIGGSSIATMNNVSIPALFHIACGFIIIQIIIMYIYGSYFPYPMHADDDYLLLFGNDSKYDDMDDDNDDYEMELEKKAFKARQEKQKRRRRKILIKSTNTNNNHHDNDNNVNHHHETLLSNAKVYFSGVFLILKHNYLLLILGVSCLYEISLTCLDYEMKLIGLDRFTSDHNVIGDINEYNTTTTTTTTMIETTKDAADTFTTFMGRFGQLTNLLSLILSYYLFPYLMSNHGLKYTIRIFPTLLLFVTFMTFVALPMNLPVLFVSMSLLKAMTYSVNDPAKEILYIPTSNTVKFKVKFWIDVVGARIAKAIGSSINTYAGTAERIVQYGSLPSVVAAVALWLVCYAAGMKFDELLENGEIVGSEEEEEEMDENGFSSLLYVDDYEEDDDESDMNGSSVFHSNDTKSFDESESGWESNVTVELVQLNQRQRK